MERIKCLYFTEIKNYETLSLKVIENELLPKLAQLGVSVKSFCITHSDIFKKHKNLDFVLSAMDRHIRYPIAANRKLRGDFDIYHILHSINSTMLFAKPNQSKAIVTCHDIHSALPYNKMEFTLRKGGRIRNAFKRIANKAFKKADHIIAVSKNTKRDLVNIMKIPEEKITVVYNGVNHSVFYRRDKKEVRKKLKISSDEKVILNVSSDEPRKNVETILAAVAVLKEKMDMVKFVHIGELSAKSREIIRKNNLTSLVYNTPYVPQKQLVEWYNAADVFVFPSFYEGFGMPVLEAMACGCPVITTNRSSLPEVAGEAAMVTEPADVSGFVKNIEKILAIKKIYNAMRKKSLEQAKKFSWQRCAKETVDVYHCLIT
ncbi:MAG: glycosyltransferase family 4 protein [Sedimentisphaerales bacterium]|nr:glycosyltransferase family 4 protein [Sedimentisphaerales bacterium]